MLQYKTVERVLADRPTVVMMAHINPLKDIVTAIRAAKIIVEEYKVAGMVLCSVSLHKWVLVMLSSLRILHPDFSVKSTQIQNLHSMHCQMAFPCMRQQSHFGGDVDYQLLVYGNKRQDEMYCAKCERLIKKLGMEEHVALKGVAKPSEILRQGWMYLQVGAFPPHP